MKERFATDATACVADARAAVRWLQAHAAELGLDPAKLVVSGSSAGGHLALWTAITATPPGGDPAEAPLQKPAALILMSPACDSSVASGQRAERFGPNPDAYSPQQHLDAKMPPTLLFHGDADTIVPFKYAVALEAKLRSTGNACEFVPMPGGGHGSPYPSGKTKRPNASPPSSAAKNYSPKNPAAESCMMIKHDGPSGPTPPSVPALPSALGRGARV